MSNEQKKAIRAILAEFISREYEWAITKFAEACLRNTEWVDSEEGRRLVDKDTGETIGVCPWRGYNYKVTGGKPVKWWSE